jgi:hypothetical protein
MSRHHLGLPSGVRSTVRKTRSPLTKVSNTLSSEVVWFTPRDDIARSSPNEALRRSTQIMKPSPSKPNTAPVSMTRAVPSNNMTVTPSGRSPVVTGIGSVEVIDTCMEMDPVFQVWSNARTRFSSNEMFFLLSTGRGIVRAIERALLHGWGFRRPLRALLLNLNNKKPSHAERAGPV